MKDKSIRMVFVVIYLIIMNISLLIGCFVIEHINKQRVQHNNYQADTDTTNRITVFLDLIIEQIKGQSLEIVIDEDIQNCLDKHANLEEREIIPILNKYLIKDEDIAGIYLVDRYGSMVCASNLDEFKDEKTFLSQFNLTNIRQKEGDSYIGMTEYPQDACTIYIARSIRSKETGDILGYLFLFVNGDYLEEKMVGFIDKVSFEVLVVDDEEHFISFPKNNNLSKLYKKVNYKDLHDTEKIEWEDKYHHIEVRDSNLNATVMGKYIGEREDNTLQMILSGVYFINMLFFIMAIFIIGKCVVYPLENIAKRADKITSRKNLDIRFDENKGYKEISSIGLALNKMLDEIQFLIAEIKEKERIQKGLELSMINYQVNPHFLYNTLNSVSVLVAVEDKETAGEIIKSLARYYRACLNKEGELNTVAQEIEIAKEYLHIALLKNPSLFEVVYQIDKDLMDYKMPRMVIQILVENAVKYGIRTMNEPLQLYVSVQVDKKFDRFIVEVRDNGKGIEGETIEHIMKDEQLNGKSGFGLRSIIKRISLIYNIKKVTDIIDIETVIGHYTKVKIYIPYERKTIQVDTKYGIRNDNNIQQ